MRTQARNAGLLAQSQSATPAFRLHRPTTVAEASDLVAEYPDATIAAGCSDLVAQIREGARVERLISLQRVDDLRRIDLDADGGLTIGSTVTHHDGSSNALVHKAVPGLADAWAAIATVRIRYTGTIGGNVMAGRTRYEMPILLGALDADHNYDSTGRLLLGVHVDTSNLVAYAYERSMRPTATLAVAVRRDAHGRLALRAVAGSEYRPCYTLTAQTAATAMGEIEIDDTAEHLARQMPDDCADHTGSAQYRRHLVRVLMSRTLHRMREKETES
ncbi:FAD binding domain-containing protein [Gordonia sp. CPCC 205515]|uniref:FAD binding domain-containing protein n=1 Tax=Gordonia sp. CPCC 205515 TaxID=3140791 RepID=UPI003AF37E30